MKYFPRANLVIVRPDKIDEITKGGLYIPDSAREQHQTAITHGTIIAIGPEADIKFSDDKEGVTKRNGKIGERVIYAKYGGSSFRSDGEEYRVLYDTDIVVSIDEDKKQSLGAARKPIAKAA